MCLQHRETQWKHICWICQLWPAIVLGIEGFRPAITALASDVTATVLCTTWLRPRGPRYWNSFIQCVPSTVMCSAVNTMTLVFAILTLSPIGSARAITLSRLLCRSWVVYCSRSIASVSLISFHQFWIHIHHLSNRYAMPAPGASWR